MAKRKGKKFNERLVSEKELIDEAHAFQFTPVKTITEDLSKVLKQRDVGNETNKVTTGNSAAFSSKQCVFYHDVPPTLYRRVALRCTGGHKKYNDDPIPIAMNLNWRIGLDDPLYMMDRLNHLIEHIVCFLEDGNTKDDNLGAIALMAGWLMECEEKCPQVFHQLWGQTRFFGRNAEYQKEDLVRIALEKDAEKLRKKYPGFKQFAEESRGIKK